MTTEKRTIGIRRARDMNGSKSLRSWDMINVCSNSIVWWLPLVGCACFVAGGCFGVLLAAIALLDAPRHDDPSQEG
jgi:hypothetical protein